MLCYPGDKAPRKNTSQTFKKEVCLQDRPCSRLGRSREHVCCKCRARFRGRLPVPRAEAALPYWVPLSLRPRKQILKTVQSPVSTPTMACLCLCHRFGGLLPVPREQAVMPYWVPRGLRSQQQDPLGLSVPAQLLVDPQGVPSAHEAAAGPSPGQAASPREGSLSWPPASAL
nr:uncharacterized protein C16orf95 homolog isoform X2 [Cavia porcellus]